MRSVKNTLILSDMQTRFILLSTDHKFTVSQKNLRKIILS